MSKPKFKKKTAGDFHTEVNLRVEEYFKKNNLSKFANSEMKIKSALHIILYVVFYAMLVSDVFSGVWLALLYASFGILQGLIGFNISHDALHGGYSSSRRVNRLLGLTFDFNGESSFVWKKTHNGAHHTYTNIAGSDGDINKAPLLRLSPHDPWRPFHRFQAFYIFFLYGLVSINWVFYGDYKLFFESIREKKAKKKDISIFFLFKAINFIVMIAVPIMVLSAPLWQIALCYFLFHYFGAFTISIIFQLAHLVHGVSFPLPNQDGYIQEEWAEHEMRTTSNFATSNAFLSYWLGGLNFQIEHHLFPQVCHVHYSKIQPIVKMTAEEYGIPYNECKTFWQAVKSHFLLLHEFGQNEKSSLGIKSCVNMACPDIETS